MAKVFNRLGLDKIKDYKDFGKAEGFDPFVYKKNNFLSREYAPIFLLSTGRTGTKLLTGIFENSGDYFVEHSPTIELIEQSKLAYETYLKYGLENDDISQLAYNIFLSAREKNIYKSIHYKHTFIETNNRITFFAPYIKKYIPNAKFIFIHRHPGEFVRSGIRRKWYTGSQNHDLGRIVPIKESINKINWEETDIIQKNTWLWTETNNFILDFFKTIPQQDQLTINFNQMDEFEVEKMINFIGGKFNKTKVKKELNSPINAQRKGDFPKYADWNQKDKDNLSVICNDLALQLKHSL